MIIAPYVCICGSYKFEVIGVCKKTEEIIIRCQDCGLCDEIPVNFKVLRDLSKVKKTKKSYLG